MSDLTDFILQSFCITEQAIKQAYLNYQAVFFPDMSYFAQAQDSPSVPSSTTHFISPPRQGIDIIYDLPHDLTSDFEISNLYPSVTMINPTNQLPSYTFDSIVQDKSSYFVFLQLYFQGNWA